MSFDFLLRPVSDAEPCGPDLDLAGDNEYFDYLFPAEGRLPERFFIATEAKIFDRSSINLASEIKSITALLERSKDLRLMVLQARFCAVVGDLSQFVATLEIIASCLDLYWTDIHPRAEDGDYIMRRNALEVLDSKATVTMPIEYAVLFKDKQIGAISLHMHKLANGKVPALANEEALKTTDIQSRLLEPDNANAVANSKDLFQRAISSFKKIKSICIDNSDYDYAPSFDAALEICTETLSVLNAGQATQSPAEDDGQFSGSNSDTGSNGSSVVAQPAAFITNIAPIEVGAILSANDVRQGLFALETYFANFEPSSPSLILARQARRLYGRPMTEVLAELLPSKADNASIVLDSHSGFSINATKMRAMSGATEAGGGATESFADAKLLAKRGEVVGLALAIERFLREAEPSSPVPLLLSKLRSFLEKDFVAILKELTGENAS
jgi:type VI secretion system protein ImpA